MNAAAEPAVSWRWDQGRLDYFQLDEIRRLAKALCTFNGQRLPRGDEPDVLRDVLASYSERPFLPSHYKLWRNYKRVVGCQMLATDVGGFLACTDLCRKVASGSISGDDYLLHIARHFSYPSPVFDDYHASAPQYFPICAIVKFLVSEFVTKAKPTISIDEILDRVRGNGCNGTELLATYANLPPTGLRVPASSDSYRQLRELLRFISQFSFLKWDNPNLILDVASPSEALAIVAQFEPQPSPRLYDAAAELLRIGGAGIESFPDVTPVESTLNAFDVEFTEGSRARGLHLRIERSRKLRELYFARAASPSVCDMCSRDTLDHYPWATRLIEIHHLLPLSSPLRVERQSTSLRDVVGLCPSCHRATHRFYSEWLRERTLEDFPSPDEARSTYALTKSQYVS